MDYQNLLAEYDGDIATIIFHRPEVGNAINETMISEIEDALIRIENSTSLRALILTGSDHCFMSGGDIKMLRTGLEQPHGLFLIHDRLTRIGVRLERLRIPVIAAINGPAIGGGLELALACDFRVMAETAHLAMPEVGLGIMPGSGGTARLVRTIGRERALFLELTGRRINADEAERMGLAGWVVPDNEVMSKARELAEQVIDNAPVSVASIKRAINLAVDMPIEGAVDYCQYVALSLSMTEDSREGLDAFLQKRKPEWKGH